MLRELEILVDGERARQYLLQIFLKEAAGTLPRSARPGRSSSRSSSARATRASAPATSARCSRASSGSRSRRGGSDARSDRWRASSRQAPHGAARRRRAAALRGVPDARRLRRPLHHPLPRRPPAHRGGRDRPRTAGRSRRRPTTSRGRSRAGTTDRRSCRGGRAAARRARAAAVQRRRGHLGRPPRRGRPGLLRQRRRRRALLRRRGRRRAALGAGRLALRRRATTCSCPRASSTASCPTTAPQVLAVDRMRGRARPAARSGATRSASCAWTRPTATATSGGPRSPGPRDEGLRDLVVKRGGAFHGFRYAALAARRGRLGRHGLPVGVPDPQLPAARRAGAPAADGARHVRDARRADLQLRAAPARLPPRRDPLPLPALVGRLRRDHLLLRGNFTSRKGVGPGSISHHPAGVMHGPHPGAYEGSIGAKRDRRAGGHARHLPPAHATDAARSVEDPEYHASFG